ncbi:MAG: PTS sugar transporter subunit IIC [Corynebacterium sp.]|nr:PTS sugar transporter subunit IIC [Corynebacterium sp.]
MPLEVEESKPGTGAKDFIMKVLNGISIAVVVTLVPQALIGELFTALLPIFPQGQTLIDLVQLTGTMLPAIIGVMVALEFKMTPMQIASVGIASVLGSGVAQPMETGGFHLSGTGLVINSGLTAAMAVGLLLWIGDRLGSYTIILLSTTVVVVVGTIGWVVTYPIVEVFTKWLGHLVNGATELQPMIMGLILAVLFSILIVSPISTVGIATAIMMEGVSSGAANLGVCAMGISIMIAGYKVNGFGTSLIHVLGSSKVQMANFFAHPKAALPGISSAAIVGMVGGIFSIPGTAISAGFGNSGFAGPLAALNYEGWGWTVGNVGVVLLCFFILPIVLGFFFNWLYGTKLGWISPEFYKLNFN